MFTARDPPDFLLLCPSASLVRLPCYLTYRLFLYPHHRALPSASWVSTCPTGPLFHVYCCVCALGFAFCLPEIPGVSRDRSFVFVQDGSKLSTGPSCCQPGTSWGGRPVGECGRLWRARLPFLTPKEKQLWEFPKL